MIRFTRFLAVAAALFALHAHAGGLSLSSDRALVVDRDTGKTLYAKGANQAAPIASVTKLMTAMVLLDTKPDMRRKIRITRADVDRLKNSSSRLPVGARLTRGKLLHLTLMSSENRAAHALARTSSLGLRRFIQAMNAKARALGMESARFADPTGLSPRNRATARDLRKLLEAASKYRAIRAYTTETYEQVKVGRKKLSYRNSNPVVGRKGWDVLLSKTGFIREAGRVVVVNFKTAGRNLAVVLMGADSTAARTRDLRRVRDWVRAAKQPRREVTAKAAAGKSQRGSAARGKGRKVKPRTRKR